MDAASLLRILGDEARLRLLRALSQEALNVSELTAVLGLAQSGVSRHLKLLREAGLVSEERNGGFTWYRLPATAGRSGDRASLWMWLETELARATPATREDDARLEEVRRLRKEKFVDHRGGDESRQFVPGRSWVAWSRALGLLLPPLDVVDLGCGEGYLTLEAARWARHVTAIDRSKGMLERARAMAGRRKIDNITWKRGDLEKLPLRDASFDVVLLSQALHHAESPAKALSEAQRILRPQGRVLILDLREHHEAWVRTKLGDRWQGFSDARLRELLITAGFDDVKIRVGARRQQADPFTVLVASAVTHS